VHPDNAGPGEQPTADSEREFAIVLTGDKLVRDYGDGTVEEIVTANGADECYADAVHKVVWMIGSKGVATFDTVDGKHHLVAETDVSIELFAVQSYTDPTDPFPATNAGNVREVDHCVALVVSIGAEPTVGGVVVGEGDRLFDCYDDVESEHLAPDYVVYMERYNSIQTFDINYLKSLEARRRKSGAQPEQDDSKTPAKPTVDIPKSQCTADPDDCGKVSYVGGRFWSVITGNDRGDFYYEYRQLYDATTREFFHPGTGDRSAKPFVPHYDLDRLIVAPGRTWAVFEGTRLSLVTGELGGEFDGLMCDPVSFVKVGAALD